MNDMIDADIDEEDEVDGTLIHQSYIYSDSTFLVGDGPGQGSYSFLWSCIPNQSPDRGLDESN
jgi:hypothetical protein